jgi:hypothetical protein
VHAIVTEMIIEMPIYKLSLPNTVFEFCHLIECKPPCGPGEKCNHSTLLCFYEGKYPPDLPALVRIALSVEIWRSRGPRLDLLSYLKHFLQIL